MADRFSSRTALAHRSISSRISASSLEANGCILVSLTVALRVANGPRWFRFPVYVPQLDVATSDLLAGLLQTWKSSCGRKVNTLNPVHRCEQCRLCRASRALSQRSLNSPDKLTQAVFLDGRYLYQAL